MRDDCYREVRAAARSLAGKFYLSFPAHTRAYMDFEDLVNIGLMHYTAKADQLDEAQSKRVTFAYNVIERRYIDLLRQARRLKCTPPGEVLELSAALQVGREDAPSCPLLTKRVSRFYALASMELRSVIDSLRGKSETTHTARELRALRPEVKHLSDITGVSAEDFRALGMA